MRDQKKNGQLSKDLAKGLPGAALKRIKAPLAGPILALISVRWRNMKLLKLSLFILVCHLCTSAQACNALRGKRFTSAIQTNKNKELFINKKFVTQGRKALITKNVVAQIIPTDMQATGDAHLVQNKILAKAAQYLANTPFIKNSFIMKTAKSVEEETSVDLNIESSSDASLTPMEHKINFDLQALKGEARLLYSGFIDSKIEFKTNNNTLQVSVEEQLSNNSKIALSHEKNNFEQRQLLQYQIHW